MITDTYHPIFDGIVRYLDYLIPELEQLGSEISVVCPWFKGEKHFSTPSTTLTIIRTMTTRIRSNAYYWAVPDWRLIKAVKEADVVVLHSLMPLGLFGGLIAKLFNKPIALFCHHDERVILKQNIKLQQFFREFLYKLISKFYSKIVDIFFCATERFRRKLLFFHTPNEIIHYLPFAINQKRFHPRSQYNIREKYNLPKNAILATYLGRLSIEKNVDRILLAIDKAIIKNKLLYGLIVGTGPDSKLLKEMQLKHSERFIFTGFIPEKELQSHFASSDVFVTPTFNESSCFTVFEAMACGAPVITSAKDHDPDIIHQHNSLLINNIENVQEITDNILKIINSEALQKKLQKNAFKLISTRSWTYHAKKFNQILESILDNKKSSNIMFSRLRSRIKISNKTEEKMIDLY
ncbi:MAG: glycosyltransferase family 4 protein [Asgard group archaeon]|nr:glycosyltransferase family 4 protein [Asgard group archaeon]